MGGLSATGSGYTSRMLAVAPPDARRVRPPTLLHVAVEAALDAAEPEALRRCTRLVAADEHDELLALLSLHDLMLAPLDRLGARVRCQGHPATEELRHRLESSYLDRLRRRAHQVRLATPDGVEGMRRVAAIDRVPDVYDWLRAEASWTELVEFLSVEGGPDAGFDDLVALAQVGITGDPKVALAENYWDEMGRGALDRVHTVLHDQLVDAVQMRRIPRIELSTTALDRMALNGVLAGNRWLQPELLGALGLLEMQAGPRCRAVVGALERLAGPAGSLPFYEEHATADPRHGKEWLDRVVRPLSQDSSWARRMVDGAVWRHVANQRFFDSWQP